MAFTLRTGLTAREALSVPGTAIAMVDSDGPWSGAVLFVHTPEQLEKLGVARPAARGRGGGGGESDSDSEGELRGGGGSSGKVVRHGGAYTAALAAAAEERPENRDALRRMRLMREAGRAASAPYAAGGGGGGGSSGGGAAGGGGGRKVGAPTAEIRLPPGAHFTPLPAIDPKARNVYYVTGPSGCGKSTWAANFGRTYYRWWGGKRPVYLISKLTTDEVMDGKEGESRGSAAERPTRLDIRSLMATPFNWASLGACLVIFDDCDTFSGEEQRAMQKLQDEIATLGRHEAISMVVRYALSLSTCTRTARICLVFIKEQTFQNGAGAGERRAVLGCWKISTPLPPLLSTCTRTATICLVFIKEQLFRNGAGAGKRLLHAGHLQNFSAHLQPPLQVLSHLASNYKHTRLILLEAQGYVVFSATPHAAKAYLLKRALGLADREVSALREFGRWTLVTKQVPLYILGESQARVIV